MIEDFNAIIDLPYDKFLERLKEDVSGEEYDLLLIAEAAMSYSFEAIKISFDRIEGLRETPVKFDIPKFYRRYVNATRSEKPARKIERPKARTEESFDILSAKLRDTLKFMRGLPKATPDAVMGAKRAIDAGEGVGKNIPLVKMVICANLILISRTKPKVISFVFEQIYGKLTHTIKLLDAEDVYIDDYAAIAPEGSFKGDDGVWICEDTNMQKAFIAGFAKMGGQYARLAEEYDGL